MKPWIWVVKVENSLPGSKSLKIGLQTDWNMRKTISKICKEKLLLPDVMGDIVGPEIKKFEPEVKKYFFEKPIQNCLESPILVFRYHVTRRR